MSPRLFLLRVVEPGLSLLPGYMVSDQARVALMAIAGQETNWAARTQIGGPARGYWQFEPNGVNAVSAHPKTIGLVASVLSTLDLIGAPIYTVIQYNDPLACVMARLLLWADPDALPSTEDADGCFEYYVRNWKPGKPDDSRWGDIYATACSTVAAGGS